MSLTRNLLKLPLVNIGPEDILNGDKKLTGALLWQLMRFHIRSLLQAVSKQGTAIDDKDLDREILAWANSRVAAVARSGAPPREIASFNDASIASGLFLVRSSCPEWAWLGETLGRVPRTLSAGPNVHMPWVWLPVLFLAQRSAPDCEIRF